MLVRKLLTLIMRSICSLCVLCLYLLIVGGGIVGGVSPQYQFGQH